GYDLILLEGDDIEELAEKTKEFGADTIVIDHYGIGYEEEKRLKARTGATIVVLDDTYERHHCDILLNHNVYAEPGRYEKLVPRDCELRCGRDHMLIREAFFSAKERGIVKEGAPRVLVAMGGADTAGLNIPILEVLGTFEELHVDVVTTRANPNLKRLEAYVESEKNLSLYIDAEMAARMSEADFAILTPSVTVNEAIFMELPFIAIQTADNQKWMSAYLRDLDRPWLSFFDRMGVRREVDAMMERIVPKLFDFTRLESTRLEEVLRWRNDPGVRRWMFDRTPISREAHFAFVESLKSREESRYFLVGLDGNGIGVVDLTKIDPERKTAHIGLYARPGEKGVGKILMRALLNRARKMELEKLVADVFEENERAIALYRRFGFETVGRKHLPSGKLSIMEKRV
ncbi:UDP-2,4-diacetamido-2,4,6-trideoxy-beta-L-altropyranose hydrolase, partial [Hydrogenimonas sp.]